MTTSAPSWDSTEEMLCSRIDRYLRQLAPHMREREGMILLGEAQAAITTNKLTYQEKDLLEAQIRGLKLSNSLHVNAITTMQEELDTTKREQHQNQLDLLEQLAQASAKIAEADKQEPTGYKYRYPVNEGTALYSTLHGSEEPLEVIPLFTRPPITSQRELELLGVIEQMREALLIAQNPTRLLFDDAKKIAAALALTPNMTALKEHDARVLTTAMMNWNYDAGVEDNLSRMASELRKSTPQEFRSPLRNPETR